ncbi:hypothetical protein Tco_1274452 [Tanacetum coccineum]
MAEQDSFLLLEWPVLEPVGALEDPPFVASLLNTYGYFKEVAGFLCLVLAPGFAPWETLSALDEVFGALIPLVGPLKSNIGFINFKLIRFHSNKSLKEKQMYFSTDFRSTFSKGDCFIPFGIKQSFFPPCKPSRSETYVSASVKEIDYVQIGIVNQTELKLQPRAFFSFCTAAYTEVKILPTLLRT